jgi:hypothetical protein
MTDNEKAATFIGWQVRDHKYVGSEGGGGTLFRVPTCDACGEYRTYHDKAPDMTDPRNYMKALATAASDVPFVWICVDPNGGGSCHIEAMAQDIKFLKAPDIMAEGDNLGEQVVKALAALYDAEHPSEV